MNEVMRMDEAQMVGASIVNPEPVRWHAHWRVDKYSGAYDGEDIASGRAGQPYEVVEGDGNLLTTTGCTTLWNGLTGVAITNFGSANANLGVGDGTAAAAVGQTDLQASTNKVRVGQDSTYPQISGSTCQFKSTYGNGTAEFAWQEWGVFNGTAAGTMLNRKVASLGTKGAGATWTLTVTLGLA